jgi:signal transduction histidine kinase
MRETTCSSAAASVPAQAVPRVQTAGGRLPTGRDPPEGGADPAEVIVYLAEDRERIARGLNDVVVRRLFAAGLDLHAALALMGDHRATGKIYHAIDELDQAIRDIRDAIFYQM